jgi:hypothetical protein
MFSVVQNSTRKVKLTYNNSLGYFLIKFVNPFNNDIVFSIFENKGSALKPIIEVKDTGDVAPNPLLGEVRLNVLGNWNAFIYKQSSSSNLNPANATFITETIVFVQGDAKCVIPPRNSDVIKTCADVKECIGIISTGSASYFLNEQGDFIEVDTETDITGLIAAGSNITISGSGTIADPYIISASDGGISHATASGTDTYTATISGVTSYSDGDAYLIRFTNGNTSGATLNINSLGAKTLYKNNDGVLIGGDIISGGEMICVYNSSLNAFQVIGTSPNTLIGYVTNADSVSLTKGMAVYAFGGQGDRMTVKRAQNTGESNSAQTVGLVLSSSIGVNQKGLIMMQGLLDGLSILPTSTFADGDPIYLGSTAGSITKTKPYAPNHLVYLGVVTTASNGSAGRMYVKVQNGYELDELHNVQAQSPTLKDTLWYDNSVSPAQWKTASIATILGYTPVASNAAITGATKTKITYDSKGLVTAGADIAASDLPSGIDAAKIADGSVSNTEFQYLDGVTSSIQTQLNNKLNYYTLFIQSLSINPADGLTYFIGSVPATPNQTANNRLFKFSTAGTLNSFIFSLLQGTNGSAETVTVSIRNNTTTVETQLGTFTSDFGANISTVISFTGLSISVNTTDNYTIKIVSPAWATNPTGWVIGGNLLVTI